MSSASPVPTATAAAPRSGRARRALRWVGWGVFFTIEGTAIGALLGAISFPLVAWAIGAERSTAEFVLLGARNLGFWFFIWSPGLALVRCTMRWHAERERDQSTQRHPTC